MTLKEADEAARRGLPVIHKGVEYARITQTGYHYDKNGKRRGFVQLIDKNSRSVSYAEPRTCELAKETET